MKTKTRKDYENYLNEMSVSYDMCWFGGKNYFYDGRAKYGSSMRKHDPIAFEVGFNDWSRN